MNFSPEFVRQLEHKLLSERRGIAKTIQGAPQIEFACPSHDDKHQSAHYHSKKQVWTCRACPAGGGMKNLAGLLGMSPDDAVAKPARKLPARGQEPVATYQYTSVNGDKALKMRYEFDEIDEETGKNKKTFTWSSAAGGKLPEGIGVKDMELYFLEDPAKRPNDPIVFVEGEKTCEAVWQRQILACTGGWASSLRDWNPKVWEPLRGREVWLSPDNDRAGFEYMDAVAAALRGIAKKIRRVKVPLPPKGDLFEFFQAGGKPEDVFSGDLDETATDILDHDDIRVRVPTEDGIIAFRATELQRSIRSLDCKLFVSVERPNTKRYTSRVNLLSASARSQTRMELSKMFEDVKCNWTEVVNEACAQIDDTFSQNDVSIDVFDIPDSDSEQFLFGDLLPVDQPTIVFGDGGSLKSYVSMYCGALLSLGMPFPGQPWNTAPEPGRALYCDFENVTAGGFRRRMTRLYAGCGIEGMYPKLFDYWPGRGIPLANQIDALRKKVREDNIRLIIIDSAAAACGGKPEDSDVTVAFFTALAKLNVTTIVIAHINREGDTQKPFGSAFWTNLARRTWFVKRAGQGDNGEVGLFCRKVNDGPLGRAKALAVHFTGLDGAVSFESESFMDAARELDRERPMGIRLVDALGQGSMTANALGTKLGSKGETVLRWLKSRPDLFVEMGSTDGQPAEWGLRAQSA